MAILVTGGAGYIGSHVVKALLKIGHEVIVVDNLSTGHAQAVGSAKLIELDLKNNKELEKVFAAHSIDSVMHFAGSIVVPESVREPLKYYENNTLNSHGLIQLCVKNKVKHFIFSSTAAVYGISKDSVCTEETVTAPINPYGSSKLMTEQMLKDVSAVNPMQFIALRYFNVAGADPEGEIGQSFPEATHLIKVACQTALGKRPSLTIFGTDYPTPDGTCVRDYIHVTDLAMAHIKALEYLMAGGKSEIVNCGYGHGSSVKEVVSRVKKLSGVDFKVDLAPRRDGDPASLTAANGKIIQLLKWKPQYDDLDLIIQSALNWEKNARF